MLIGEGERGQRRGEEGRGRKRRMADGEKERKRGEEVCKDAKRGMLEIVIVLQPSMCSME